jgi:hypothetical protein
MIRWICALLLALGPAAQEATVEDFSKDPGWEGRNNVAPREKKKRTRQDFGWRATNHTGVGGPGEVGGHVCRSLTPAWYAKVLEKPLTLEDRIHASGTFSLTADDGASGLLFGFFNKDSRGWRTPQSLVFRIDGNGSKAWIFYEYGTRSWFTGGAGCFEGDRYQTTTSKPLPADGKPHAWSLEYDPKGRGAVTFTLDGKPYLLPLEEGHKADGAVFDRFGLLNVQTSGSATTAWFDGLTIQGAPVDLSRDPGWEGVGNGVEFDDGGIRPLHDFGWDRAGGRVGGLVWRADERNDDQGAWYAAKVGPLPFDRELRASGKIVFSGAGSDSGVLIGWFNSATPFGEPGPSTVAAFLEGPSSVGHYFRPVFSDAAGVRRIAPEGPVLKPDSKPHDWTIHYDPKAGKLTTTLDGRPADLEVKLGARGTVDRFGIVTWKRGGHHVLFYLDDLTFTAK